MWQNIVSFFHSFDNLPACCSETCAAQVHCQEVHHCQAAARGDGPRGQAKDCGASPARHHTGLLGNSLPIESKIVSFIWGKILANTIWLLSQSCFLSTLFSFSRQFLCPPGDCSPVAPLSLLSNFSPTTRPAVEFRHNMLQQMQKDREELEKLTDVCFCSNQTGFHILILFPIFF